MCASNVLSICMSLWLDFTSSHMVARLHMDTWLCTASARRHVLRGPARHVPARCVFRATSPHLDVARRGARRRSGGGRLRWQRSRSRSTCVFLTVCSLTGPTPFYSASARSIASSSCFAVFVNAPGGVREVGSGEIRVSAALP